MSNTDSFLIMERAEGVKHRTLWGMDYFGGVAAIATILGLILHQIGKYSERRKEKRRWRTGRDWVHWAKTPEGRLILRDLLETIEREEHEHPHA